VSAILGVDLGERRIGIAIADGPGAGARPLTTLLRGRAIAADATALRQLIEAHDVNELVIGLPIDAAGHEGEQAARTRAWVDAIDAALGGMVVVSLQDERLTSHVAETRLGPMPRGRSGGPPSRHQRDTYRARVDREAAAIILQDSLDSRAAARDGSAQIRTQQSLEPRP
jgi:putative pre-16S rRNA nuclease